MHQKEQRGGSTGTFDLSALNIRWSQKEQDKGKYNPEHHYKTTRDLVVETFTAFTINTDSC